MPGHFEPLPGGGAAVALDEVEISIIRSLAVQLLELIGPGPAENAPDDPLAELFAEGPSEPPSDPVLQRLFPDAYSGPDVEASSPEQAEEQRAYSSEFRRFTENDLRAGKRENALAVIRSLDALTTAGDGGAVLKLSPGSPSSGCAPSTTCAWRSGPGSTSSTRRTPTSSTASRTRTRASRW